MLYEGESKEQSVASSLVYANLNLTHVAHVLQGCTFFKESTTTGDNKKVVKTLRCGKAIIGYTA